MPLPDTDAARKLWQMTDPYSYRDKVTMPKFIINGANDPYWTVDALNFYWDALKGDKWVCTSRTPGHNLAADDWPTARKTGRRAIDSLSAFGRRRSTGRRLAKVDVDARRHRRPVRADRRGVGRPGRVRGVGRGRRRPAISARPPGRNGRPPSTAPR